MRPLWTGSISFGLVNIPVRLFSGANPREGIDLDMLHKQDHAPIRYARICRKDGQEVPWEDIVKGYEYREGDHIVLTQKDLESFDAKKTQTIDIKQFTQEGDIDLRYFEKPYYLEPIKGGEKAYNLLHQALEQSKKLALATFVLRDREHLAVIKPVGSALVLNQMRFPTDLKSGANLNLPKQEAPNKSELDMALKLINQETKPFIAEDFHDTYTEELEQFIKEKTKGKKITHRDKATQKTDSKDLIAALKASLKEK